mgnify:CR=1 FL=1
MFSIYCKWQLREAWEYVEAWKNFSESLEIDLANEKEITAKQKEALDNAYDTCAPVVKLPDNVIVTSPNEPCDCSLWEEGL